MKKALIVAGIVGAMALTGCSAKQVDQSVTGAQLVPGTGNLYRFCDGDTLVYYSDWSGTDDQYEFIVYGGCAPSVPNQAGVQNLPDADDK